MRYFVSAADDDLARRTAERLRSAGYEVVDEYEDGAVIVSLGGDGAILYNARRYGEVTILPVVIGGSEGNRIQVGPEDLERRVETLERGREGEDYRVERHRKLGAFHEGERLAGIAALNDVQIHHASPVRAAKFRARIVDDGVVYDAEKTIGDGLVVATPFGSTAYFRSIAGGHFHSGIGVAFNNVHKPADAPEFVVLSEDARVELAARETHGANAVLAHDDDAESYELSPHEEVVVELTDETVDILRFEN